jgi:hypothetical protein
VPYVVALVSKYEYVTDALGRRTSVVTTGAAFSPSRFVLDTPRRTKSAAAPQPLPLRGTRRVKDGRIMIAMN